MAFRCANHIAGHFHSDLRTSHVVLWPWQQMAAQESAEKPFSQLRGQRSDGMVGVADAASRKRGAVAEEESIGAVQHSVS